jgi:XTP/dITP diphosphohydrolase
LQLAAKLQSRAERAGVVAALPPAADPDGELGAQLFELVRRARAAGLDAEAALRRAALRYATAVRAAESDESDPAVEPDPDAETDSAVEPGPAVDSERSATESADAEVSGHTAAGTAGPTESGSAGTRHAP